MVKVETLKRKLSHMARTITNIYCFVNNQNATHYEIKARVIELDNVYAKYKDIHDELDVLCKNGEQMQLENGGRDQIENMYFTVKAIWLSQSHSNLHNIFVAGDHHQASTPNIINDLTNSIQTIIKQLSTITPALESLSVTLSNITNIQSSNVQTELHLPPIQLPDFDGDISKWIRFRELFKAMVDTKTNLSNVEKLEYLQTKLKGEASSIIKHLPLTNDNYNIAWSLIMENYDRPHLLEKHYFDLILKQKSLKNATFEEFKGFYNNTVGCYNALKAINTSLDSWNPVLLHHIEDKLDVDTMILWRRESKDDEAQTFPQLIKFLKRRLLELEEIQRYKSPTGQSRKKNKAAAMSETTKLCPACNNNHFLNKCSVFEFLDTNERRRVALKNKLCFNCLRGEHFAKACRSGPCRICNLKHNILLHIEANESKNQQNENSDSVSVNSSQTVRQE